MAALEITPTPLTADNFSTYGDVIEAADTRENWLINEGHTRRFNNLAKVDVLEEGGSTLINIFRSEPLDMPLPIRSMERHPLSSQAFVPLSGYPYLVIVAAAGPFEPDNLRAFLAGAHQGVNYHRGTWHHYCVALVETSNFLVVDRGGPGENCDEVHLDQPVTVSIPGFDS